MNGGVDHNSLRQSSTSALSAIKHTFDQSNITRVLFCSLVTTISNSKQRGAHSRYHSASYTIFYVHGDLVHLRQSPCHAKLLENNLAHHPRTFQDAIHKLPLHPRTLLVILSKTGHKNNCFMPACASAVSGRDLQIHYLVQLCSSQGDGLHEMPSSSCAIRYKKSNRCYLSTAIWRLRFARLICVR